MLWNSQPNLKHRVAIFVTVKVWLDDFNNFVIYDKMFYFVGKSSSNYLEELQLEYTIYVIVIDVYIMVYKCKPSEMNIHKKYLQSCIK